MHHVSSNKMYARGSMVSTMFAQAEVAFHASMAFHPGLVDRSAVKILVRVPISPQRELAPCVLHNAR